MVAQGTRVSIRFWLLTERCASRLPNLEQSVPLNDLLLAETARLCAALLLGASDGTFPLPPGAAADLLSWAGPQQRRLEKAFASQSQPPADARVVPLDGPAPTWWTLRGAHAWPAAEHSVLTPALLPDRAGAKIVDTPLSAARIRRLDAAAAVFAERRLQPSATAVADWAEAAAGHLASTPLDSGTWAVLYEPREGAPRRHPGGARGRRILFDDDDDGRLRRCNAKASDGRTPSAFFPPADGEPDMRPPRRLRRRVFFVSADVARKSPRRRGHDEAAGTADARGRARQRVPRQRPAPSHREGARDQASPELASELLIWAFRFC